MITPQDKELLAKKGISEEQIANQLACFEKGFPYLKLYAAASVDKGILAPGADEQKKYLDAWEAYTQTDKEPTTTLRRTLLKKHSLIISHGLLSMTT